MNSTSPCIYYFNLTGQQKTTKCTNNECPFSHDDASLKNFPCPKFFSEQALCPYGDKCLYSHKEEHKPRKVFYGPNKEPILACSILLYKKMDASEMERRTGAIGYLFYSIVHPERGPEEPGGKTGWDDETPFDTAKRHFKIEVETDLPQISEKRWTTTYCPKSKSLLWTAEFRPDYDVKGGKGKWVEYNEGLFVRAKTIIEKLKP